MSTPSTTRCGWRCCCSRKGRWGERRCVAGDSSGGNFVAAVAAMAHDDGFVVNFAWIPQYYQAFTETADFLNRRSAHPR